MRTGFGKGTSHSCRNCRRIISGLDSLRKNSDLDLALKGCGFQPHRNSPKINAALQLAEKLRCARVLGRARVTRAVTAAESLAALTACGKTRTLILL